MSKEHFGLTHTPLGKKVKKFWDDGQQLSNFTEKFQWLLESPGVGLLTGEPGVGKTAALRQITQNINPNRYQLIYMPETDFGRVDLYRHLALALGLEPSSRRATLWREIKTRILELYDGKNVLPIWVIDEAQNLPTNFFIDLPSFLNFALDSRDLITVWLVGHPALGQLLDRVPYAALASRISARVKLKPIMERDRFHAFIDHALKEAGSQVKLLSDSGLEILRESSQGKPRHVSKILSTAMKIGALKGLNHLPDEILLAAIESLK
jgi:type II secretory pathway predicted ATPase ExeA